MTHRLREFLRRVEAIGWTYMGQTPGGHIQLQHATGVIYVAPKTPSDYRDEKNTLAALERLGGQRLPRVKHRRGRQRKQVDLQLEAARRRHRQAFEADQERRQAERDAAERIQRAAVRAAADDRRRREIEELMKP